ncbi:T9SS type A sorting domain-containing protein [Xanthomarina sp. GH4-25]|uniref:T9SS type A sorting domain-containing protein n=1 Tax=Xanthomarina sp. GH4-25 TaxID=3349335 RepID=UPI0038779F3E
MKKITLLLSCVFCFTTLFQSYGQDRSIESLIEVYNNIEISQGSVLDHFNVSEIHELRKHLKKTAAPSIVNRNPLVGTIAYGIENGSLGYGSYDTEAPAAFNTISAGSGTLEFEGSGAINPTDNTTGYVVDSVGTLYSFDVLTGVYTNLGSIGLPGGLNGLEFDSSGNLYGVDATNLYTIDTAAPSATIVGPLGTTGALAIALAIDNTGTGYTYDVADDSAYSINLATGAATLLGATGFDANYGQGMFYDGLTDKIFLAAFNFTTFIAELRELDKTTGNTTLIGVIATAAGTSQLGWSAVQGGPLENFTCDDAVNAYIGITNTDGISNTSGGASNTCFASATNAIWYSYTATNTGNLTITSDLASNTGVDTRVSVYNDDCTNLTCIDSDDNSGANNTSTVVIPVMSGTTYLIEWDDANNADAFDFELSLDISCPDPMNFAVGTITDTSADFSWDAVAEATNGYVLSVFNAGDDPDVDTPIYTENIPSGTLTATATPLMSNSMFDAYLMVDCDTSISNSVSLSFETEITPPACGGTYVDTGGESDGYSPSENITTTITPDVSGDVVTVTFTYVDIETSTGTGNQEGCWDFLTVYNGPDASFPVLAQTLCGEESGDGGTPSSFPGSLLSVGMSFTSTDATGALTFVFTSDGSIQETGWVADVTCGPPPTCVTPGAFTNTATTETTATYTWDEIANASNGYVFSVFNDGDDPQVDTPVYTENVAFGTNTATATGLMPATTYDAYIMADCDTDGMSATDADMFTTEAAPPECGGTFVDSGGVSAGYSANENITTTITPDVTGEYVTVTFTYVDIETATAGGNQEGCWDYLTIYDGPDASYPVLAQTLCGEESGDGSTPTAYPGSLLSVGDSFTSSDASGALTFVFTSDGTLQETGWIADITCGELSIDEFSTTQFNYYPNPTTGLLHINAKQIIDNIQVINMLGQEVMSLSPGTMKATLDFSSLSQGAYFLRSSINGNLTTHKIIKR